MHRDYKTRNILSLEERVQVIRDYEQNPVYQRIAEKYNCSSKQIKNILNNKEAVLLYHANRMADGSTTNERRQRQQKIAFLGKVIFEYIQRAVYHGFHLNGANVRQKALEVKESIAIMNFYPNNAWMQNFKAQYNIPEFDLMILRQSMFLSEAKEESFKAVDIIQYMSRREKQLEKIQLQQQQQQRLNGNNFHDISSSYDDNDQNETFGEDYGEPTVTYEQENDDDDDFNEYAEDDCVQLSNENHKQSSSSSPPPAQVYGKRGATTFSSNGIVNLADDDDFDNTTELNSTTKRQKLNSSNVHLPEITTSQEALRYLKALEDYAMLGENYRAIGLIEQLEQVLKNPPKSEDFVA